MQVYSDVKDYPFPGPALATLVTSSTVPTDTSSENPHAATSNTASSPTNTVEEPSASVASPSQTPTATGKGKCQSKQEMKRSVLLKKRSARYLKAHRRP